MADYTPVFSAGQVPYTSTAGATIVGGQLLFASGVNAVTPTAGANGATVGVAAHDAASGATVTVWPLVGCIHETTTPAGVTAGAALSSSTAGGVDSGVLGTLAAAGTFLGTAINTATAGNKVRWTAR
jgi:hypothetical protein